MSKLKSDSSQVADSWDTYWHGTGDVEAYSSGGVSHPAIEAFWDEFFQSVKRDYTTPAMIDIASGNGAVVERALAAFGDDKVEITCLDVSEAAIANIKSRFPHVRGLLADARSIPLDPGGFNVASSQFGVEYAGLEAIEEAARQLSPGGRMALLMHNQASSIHQECVASLDAIVRLRDSRFIEYASRMLAAGFQATRGADRAPYDEAATQLAPAVQALEAIMTEHGQNVAGDTIVRLYSDVDRIHRGMQRYEPSEVLDWLKRMDGELDAYAGRMSSMSQSAIDGETFDRICSALRGQDYTIDRAEPLLEPGSDLPLAWVLIVTK
jgi:SAM-dependent methyltransferase